MLIIFVMESLKQWLQNYKLEVIVGGVGLFLIIIGGLLWMVDTHQKNSEIKIIPASQVTTSQDNQGEVVVDVAGAVKRPGVYKLPAGSRVGEAIEAAGGLADNADKEWLAKNLNLAAKIVDGAKIYLPKVGQTGVPNMTGNHSQVIGSQAVNLNFASQKELESLPGVGPVTANKIIEGRPYTSIEELLTRKIVGKSVYDKIKDKVTVY